MAETVQTGLSDNSRAAISYITFVPAIVFLVMPPYNASPNVRFHAWQSIILNIVAFVVLLAVNIAGITLAVLFSSFTWYVLGKLILLCWVLVWILCVINALNGRRFKLPIIGALAERQAGA